MGNCLFTQVDVRAVPIPVLVTQAGLALAVKCLTVLVTLTVTTMVSAMPQVIRHTAGDVFSHQCDSYKSFV